MADIDKHFDGWKPGMKLENRFQRVLLNRLRKEYPEALVFKSSPWAGQGFPDITILFEDGRWACLECKRSARAELQSNQNYWVNWCDVHSFGAFIYPENAIEVFDRLKHFYEHGNAV